VKLLLPQRGNIITSFLMSVCDQDYVKSFQTVFIKPCRIMEEPIKFDGLAYSEWLNGNHFLFLLPFSSIYFSSIFNRQRLSSVYDMVVGRCHHV